MDTRMTKGLKVQDLRLGFRAMLLVLHWLHREILTLCTGRHRAWSLGSRVYGNQS